MIQKFFKAYWIHFAAVGIFLLLLLLFMGPNFSGMVLHQHDTTSWRAMAQSAFEYNDKNGHFPLWNTNLFSGMPNFQIAGGGGGVNIMPNLLKIITLGLPEPSGFFFAAAICFYFLCNTFGVNKWVAILGGCIYSLCTYNLVITAAGHQTKMLAVACLPGLIASIRLLFNKQYILGLFLTSLFFCIQLSCNHIQITFYLAFLVGFYVLFQLIYDIAKTKKIIHAAICSGILLTSTVIALFYFSGSLLTNQEYVKYTMRGGGNIKVDQDGKIKDSISNGLGTDYAFQYSHGKAELFTFAMPESFGGRTPDSYDPNYQEGGDLLGDESNVVKRIQELEAADIPQQQKAQIADGMARQPKYWGSVGITNGPWFVGSITVLLALCGFVVLKNKNKWWLLAAAVFCSILAMGENLLGLNTFLFNNIPLFNKFRAPATALFVTQFALVFMAILALNETISFRNQKSNLVNEKDTILKEEVDIAKQEKSFFDTYKYLAITIGGFIGIALLYYLFGEFNADRDKALLAQLSEQKTNPAIGKAILKGFIEDRKSMFLMGILRVIFYAVVLLGALFLYVRKIVPALAVVGILGLFMIADLFVVGSKYLGKDRFQDKEEYSKNFDKTPSDIEILKDTAKNYRIVELNGNMFNDARPAYFHKSIAGYSPVKLRIYQDLIEAYLNNPGQNLNILNMLNTKYAVVQNDKGQNSPPQLIPGALGNAWFVKHTINGGTPAKELGLLKGLTVKDTAVISGEDFSKVLPSTVDTSATIKLTQNDADHMIYEANTKTNQFAVFSEVYYPAGWNAYIDGKPTDILKTNYVLRGMNIPAGNHKIEMKFEPKSVKLGQTLSLAAQVVLYLLLFLVIGKYALDYKKKASI
jgi:hypothetical protein